MQIYVLNLLICFFELFICFLLTEETLILTALSDFLCLFYIHLNNINAVFYRGFISKTNALFGF